MDNGTQFFALKYLVNRLGWAFITAWILTLVWLPGVQAQGPLPVQGAQPLDQVERLTMPPVDVSQLQQQDQLRAQSGQPPRFAQKIPVKLSPATHGTWEKLADGKLLWRLRLKSAAAVSLNLGFSRFVMPPGGRLLLYPPDLSQIVGPFTAADNDEHGQLWTPMVNSDELVIELVVPAVTEFPLELTLTAVNHGYVKFGDTLAIQSGSCNVDVACTEANPWRPETRSVAVYSVDGVFNCTGALVNNTAQDFTPYFLTANHCGVDSSNAASMVVYWNYDNSTCRLPGSTASGSTGDGSLSQFNSGAFFRAAYAPSDMTLLELDDPVDPAFNPHWAGWDNSGVNPTSAVTVHHPNTEEKRISFEYNPLQPSSYLNTATPGDGSHWLISDWDLGTTEPGSSGSPLFDQNHRIVGQLHGGYAACGNNEPDWYGRLSMSWVGGGTAGTQLQAWLDPLSSGATALNGIDTFPDFSLTATPPTLAVCRPNPAEYSVAIGTSQGYNDPVTFSVTGQPAGAGVSFSANPVTPPGTSRLTINSVATVAGRYNIAITGVAPTSTHVSTVALNLYAAPPGQISLSAPGNGTTGSSLAPTLQWQADAQAAAYLVEVATDPGFSSLFYTATVAATTYPLAAPLQPNTTYYWRVTSQNACGSGLESAIFSFTTADIPCQSPNLTVPDNDPVGVADTMPVSPRGIIADLQVTVVVTHTWVGDLALTLEHVDTGTQVTLIDRPGLSEANPFGCGGVDISATLDDEASLPVADQCSGSVPTISGTFSPNQNLAVFDGELMTGTWQLRVTDTSGFDTGTLARWCLLPTLTPAREVYLPLVIR